ncbi:MAG: MmgE/PrpD family protein [Chloroflexi bacterium]|nr:MmgE/PrpD family protein [Chloroflexota bacterium]
MALSNLLAEFVVGYTRDKLKTQVIDRAKILVLDQLGCALIGSTLKWNQAAYHFVRDFESKPESTILNHGTKALAHDAAFVNGTFGQGAELDDYQWARGRAGAHAGAICVPTALALGEKARLGGADFLTAVAVGYDVAWSLGRDMHFGVHARGFHPHSVIGVFAATAVAGKILGLTSKELTNAFGIAGSHASGTMEYDQSGGEVKRVHNGIAVRSGIQSAMLSSYGLTGPATIFEGKRGIFRLFAGVEKPEALALDLTIGSGVINNGIKQYPANASQQSSIDVLADLMKKNGLKAADVERIDVDLNEDKIMHCGSIYEPQEAIQAQFSLPFSLAIRLLKGSNDLGLYMDRELWHERTVLDLAHRIHLHPNPEAKGDLTYLSRMRVSLRDGHTLEARSDYPKGSSENPLTKEEVCHKFRKLASAVLPDERVEEVIRSVDNIEQMADVSQLARLLVK